MPKKRKHPSEGDGEEKDGDLSYMSPVETEVLTRKQLKILKKQRREERKRRKKLLLQASVSDRVSSSMPKIIRLPDLSDPPSKKKKTKKQKKAQDILTGIEEQEEDKEEEEKVSLEVHESKSGLYELKSMSEMIKDYPHLSLTAHEEPLCERQQSMRIKKEEKSVSSSSSAPSSSEEEDEKEKKHQHQRVIKMSGSARKKLQLQTQALDPSTLFYHKHAQWESNNPYDYPDFHAMLQKNRDRYSTYVHGVDALSNREITPERWAQDLSHQTHVVLEKRTASFESLLLKEAGKFFNGERWIYYPSCKNMHKCIGWTQWMHIKGLQRPILLMCSMSEQEYEQDVLGYTGSLVDHMQKYEAKTDRQPCVLCCRYTTHRLLMKHALLLSQGKPTPLQRPVDPSSIVYDDHVYDMKTLSIQSYYNLKNETDGYDGDYMLDPSRCQYPHNNTLHFQPIVRCCLMKLFAYQDDQLRRVISQEALIWKVQGQGVEPVLGETVSSFLSSNKQQVGKNQDNREDALSSLLKFMVLCLLREYDPTQYIPVALDLIYIEQQMTNGDIPHDLSYAYTLLYDAYMLSPLYQSMSTQIDMTRRDELGWYYIRCDFTLSSLLDQATNNMAFFSPLADVISPLGHLLTKVLVNARCQHREMDKGVAKTLIQRKIHKRKRSTHKNKDHVIEYDDQVLMIMKQVVLCALLGNYPTDARHGLRISNMGYRYLLYYLFHNNRRFDQWIVCLFKHSSSVLTFCVRRYMVHVLESNPAMREVLHQQFRFDEYKQVVISAMHKIQALFYVMMVIGPGHGMDSDDLCIAYQECMSSVPLEPCNLMKLWDHPRYKDISTGGKGEEQKKQSKGGVHPSVLPIALQSKQFMDLYLRERENQLKSGWDDQHPHLFHTLLQKQLLQYELDYRLLSFSRPYINIALLLRPLRNDYPLVPIHSAEEDDKICIKKEEEINHLHATKEGGDDDDDEEEREQNNYMFPKDQPDKYLNRDQVRALYDVISCCGPVGYDSPIQRILDFFPFFEIHNSHVLWLKELFFHYHHNTKSNESIKLALGTLRLIDPHAYNLLQLMSIHLDQAQRRFRLMNLPWHIQQAQCRLLSKGRGGNVLLKDLISFVSCPVCCHIYSNVSDYNSVYKHSYIYGYRDVAVDYLSVDTEGKMYCTNNKSNSRGTCGQLELARVPLIGRLLWSRSKFYMFCSQCGNILAFDTKQQHYTAHTEHGPCCVRCTRLLVHKLGSQTMELLESNYALSELSCDYCKSIILHQNQQDNTNLPPPKIKDWKDIHMYGRDHFLCTKHHYIYHTKIENELSKRDEEDKEQRIARVLNQFNPAALPSL